MVFEIEAVLVERGSVLESATLQIVYCIMISMRENNTNSENEIFEIKQRKPYLAVLLLAI